MRDIDFVPDVVAELAPQLPEIERRFNAENEQFKKLLAKDHELIGRVLKCHLIIENYVNRHLVEVAPKHDWLKARLNFSQKLSLLPSGNPKVEWILPGIKNINAIRNKFGHDIEARVELQDLNDCIHVLSVARRNKKYVEPSEIIEDFTVVSCTWLIVDSRIDQIFSEAFSRVKKRAGII